MSLEKRLLAFALFACSAMGAIEMTIVTTAIPSIVKDLSGFNLSSYIFSIFLLTSAIANTVFGKLADVYGKKKLVQISIVLFLIGSVLCGLSKSMLFLIIARGIQGLGSGGLITLTNAIIGDVYEVEERAKIFGYNSTIWSLMGLIAPMLGGLILIKLTWHWVFYINIPVGILSMYLIHKSYNTLENRKDEKVDFGGLTVMSLFVVCLIQAMSSLEKNSFLSINVAGLLALAIVFMILFIKLEKKSENPILPQKIFSKEMLFIMVITFLNSGILIAMDVYNPSFMQSVQGYSPIMSIVPIVPMSAMWVASSFILSKVIRGYSTKSILIVSLGILAVGVFGLVNITPTSHPAFMAISAGIVGFGFGGSFNMLLFVVQETLPKEDMGMASGAVMFIRTLGSTIGISACGLVLNSGVSKYFKNLNIEVETSSILSNKSLEHSDVINALFKGYNNMYTTSLIVAVVCVLMAFLLQSNKKLENYND